MSDVTVALEALRSDAGVWDRAGEDLTDPRNTVGALGVTPADVSMYGVDAGIDRTYRDAQAALGSMLSQAAENFHNLGNALRQAATLYEQQEAQHSQRVTRASGN
jgi:hypothetical protein